MNRPWRVLVMLTLASVARAAEPAAAPADLPELPVLKPGLWSFSLTENRYDEKNPRVRTMTRCADPAEEMRQKWRSLAGHACRFSPVAHEGSRWSYSSACNDKGRTLTIRSVIVADRDDGYRVDTSSHTPTQASREIVIAHRVGDCTK